MPQQVSDKQTQSKATMSSMRGPRRPSIRNFLGGGMVMMFLLCGPTCASSSESSSAGASRRHRSSSGGIVIMMSEQLVAMIPNSIEKGGAEMKWAHVKWDKSSKDASGAALKLADLTDPRVSSALGSWADFSAPNGTDIQLTCKTDEPHKTTLLCLSSALGSTPKKRFGCCADSIVVQRRDSRRQQVIYFVNELRDAMISDGIAQSDAEALLYGSHTFAVERDSRGALQMALVVEFINNDTFPELGIVEMNAVVVLTLHEALSSHGDVVITSASVLKTMSGKNSFLPYRDIGSLSTEPKDLICRVQYVPQAPESNSTSSYRQWHMNGILRFNSRTTAEPLLAFTHYGMHESIIVSDPWAHPLGMVTIRQRFGAAPVYNASGEPSSTLHFGVASNNGQTYGACHNVWFRAYPNGRETLTTFWNVQGGDNFSKVFEYDIALSPVCDDSNNGHRHQQGVRGIGISCPPTMLFPTSYTRATLPFQNGQQGGARPIGNGVYISSTGAVRRGSFAPKQRRVINTPDPNGLYVVDVRNRTAAPLSYPEGEIPPETKSWGLYDPFLFVDLETRPSVGGDHHSDPPGISTGSYVVRGMLVRGRDEA